MVLIENQEYLCEEEKRLKQDRERTAYWKRWGPYVAERQWATGQSSSLCFYMVWTNTCAVREDYSWVPFLSNVFLTPFLANKPMQSRWRCLES